MAHHHIFSGKNFIGGSWPPWPPWLRAWQGSVGAAPSGVQGRSPRAKGAEPSEFFWNIKVCRCIFSNTKSENLCYGSTDLWNQKWLNMALQLDNGHAGILMVHRRKLIILNLLNTTCYSILHVTKYYLSIIIKNSNFSDQNFLLFNFSVLLVFFLLVLKKSKFLPANFYLLARNLLLAWKSSAAWLQAAVQNVTG